MTLTPFLLRNEALPWSLALLERFEDRWDWDHLSGNKSLPTPVLTEQDIDEIMSKVKNS